MPENTNEVIDRLNSIRADIAKDNKDVATRIDRVVADVEARATESKALRKEVDELKERAGQIVKDHEDLKKRSRVEAFRRSGIKDEQHGYFLVGAGLRDKLATQNGADWVRKMIPTGESEQLKEYRATLIETGSGSGAELIPTGFAVDLLDTIEAAADTISDADVQINLPGNLDLPTITARPTFNHKRAAKTSDLAKSAPAFGKVQFRPEEGSLCFDIDLAMFRMSPVALGQAFVQLINDAMTGALSHDLAFGDGTDSYNEITGFMVDATAANVYSLPAGKTSFGDIVYHDFWSILAKPLARSAQRGRFYMSRDVLGIVAAIQTTNKQIPLINYEGGMYKLLQRDIRLIEDFPGMAGNAPATKFMAFGDLYSYLVGMVGTPDVAFDGSAAFERAAIVARLLCYFDIVKKHDRGMCSVATAAAQG